MNIIKSLWATVQGDPVFMRKANGWATVFFVALVPFSMIMGWLDSVVYVSALSIWALVSGHLSAWQAARVEVVQEDMRKKQEEEEGKIVSQIADAVISRLEQRDKQ